MSADKAPPATIASNKNAGRSFSLLERFDAGLVLVGTEVKSIRQNGANVNDAYGLVEGEEIYLINMDISPYSHGNRFNHEPRRKRKLLLHKHEIRKLIGAVVEKGLTLIPVKLFWSKGRVKVELALAKGKTKGDRREDVKRRTANREIDQAVKRGQKR